MKITTNWLLAGGLAAAIGVAPGFAFQQDEPLPAEEPAPVEESAQEAAETVTGLEFDGTLKAVDPVQRIILVTSADGEELLFHYDDATEVLGQDSVQGLTGEGGTMLHIDYRAEGDRAIAERIEPQMSPSDENPAPEGNPAPAEPQPEVQQP